VRRLAVLLALLLSSLAFAPAPLPRRDREAPGFTNSVNMRFVRIKAGTFLMGSAADDRNASDKEKPRHEAEITRDFFVGVTEVTQKQYQAVMGHNPSHYSKDGRGGRLVEGLETDDFPVECVSWHDAQDFLKKLTALPAEEGRRRKYRLPTEAEWEYCCRAGTANRQYHFGDRLTARDANFQSKVGRTCKVGSYKPNAWGLYDVHGNVWEWCQDVYASDYYARSPLKDPVGPKRGTQWVLRGGGEGSPEWACRAAFRYSYSTAEPSVGFRAVCVRQD